MLPESFWRICEILLLACALLTHYTGDAPHWTALFVLWALYFHTLAEEVKNEKAKNKED